MTVWRCTLFLFILSEGLSNQALFRYLNGDGPIAQLWLERTPDKREVDGSTPSRPTGGKFQIPSTKFQRIGFEIWNLNFGI